MGGSWGFFSGLGQGLQNAGNTYASLMMAQKRLDMEKAYQTAQIGLATKASDRADLQQKQEATLQGFVNPNQVEPSGTSDESSNTSPDTAGPLSPVGNLTQGGSSNPFAPSSGQTTAGKPNPGGTGQQGAMPYAGMFDILQRASQATTNTQSGGVNRSQPGPTNQAAQSGQLGGYDTSRYIPAPNGQYLDIQGPQFQRQMALMRAMKAAELANDIAVKGAPQGPPSPEQLDFENRQLAQTGAYQRGELAARNRQIDIEGAIRKTLAGLTLGKTGESYASDFARRTQDDRKAGEIGQQLDDAYGQATGATTPDGKPNPAALKSLVTNQIASTEPGMRVNFRTLSFNGTGGDASAAGKIASTVMTAIGGLPPQQQLAALHSVFGQMNATKMQRYAREYQAEAAAHPEIPNYEQNYLRPTMAPEFVFGAGAKAATDWRSTLADAQAALAHHADIQHVRARYRTLTGRDYDSDAGSAATNAAAPSQ